MAGRRKNPLHGDNYYEGTGMQDMRYIDKYLEPDKSGMITGAWDKAKEIGGEWWKNISSDKGAYRREFDAKWLKKLGYEGMPRLEMYKGESAEAEFDRDWREYWDTHYDNHSIY